MRCVQASLGILARVSALQDKRLSRAILCVMRRPHCVWDMDDGVMVNMQSRHPVASLVTMGADGTLYAEAEQCFCRCGVIAAAHATVVSGSDLCRCSHREYFLPCRASDMALRLGPEYCNQPDCKW